MARPTKLTRDRHDLIVKLLRAGNYLETAAAAAGVSVACQREWLRRGEREADAGKDTVYTRFWSDASAAMAQAEARDVAFISQAAATDWRAAAWRLEHRHPDRWGPRRDMKVEHSGSAGLVVALTRDEVRRAARMKEEG